MLRNLVADALRDKKPSEAADRLFIVTRERDELKEAVRKKNELLANVKERTIIPMRKGMQRKNDELRAELDAHKRQLVEAKELIRVVERTAIVMCVVDDDPHKSFLAGCVVEHVRPYNP